MMITIIIYFYKPLPINATDIRKRWMVQDMHQSQNAPFKWFAWICDAVRVLLEKSHSVWVWVQSVAK